MEAARDIRHGDTDITWKELASSSDQSPVTPYHRYSLEQLVVARSSERRVVCNAQSQPDNRTKSSPSKARHRKPPCPRDHTRSSPYVVHSNTALASDNLCKIPATSVLWLPGHFCIGKRKPIAALASGGERLPRGRLQESTQPWPISRTTHSHCEMLAEISHPPKHMSPSLRDRGRQRGLGRSQSPSQR